MSGSNIPWPDIGGPSAAKYEYGLPLPEQIVRRFTNRAGTIAVGDVLVVDVEADDGASTTLDNATTSGSANLIAVAAGHITGFKATVCAVVTDLLTGAGADNTEVLACIYGPCTAKVAGIGVTGEPGDPLTITTNEDFDAVLATGERIFAHLNADITLTTATQDTTVIVTNGWWIGEAYFG